MIAHFRASSIQLSVANDKIYDDTTSFNEQNIKEYLAEVEEYVKCLLTLAARELHFEHPMLASLGIDDLPKKIEAAVIPKEVLPSTEEEEEEPDEQAIESMMNEEKFDSMVVEILKKRREAASKSMVIGAEEEAGETKKTPNKSVMVKSPGNIAGSLAEKEEGIFKKNKFI